MLKTYAPGDCTLGESPLGPCLLGARPVGAGTSPTPTRAVAFRHFVPHTGHCERRIGFIIGDHSWRSNLLAAVQLRNSSGFVPLCLGGETLIPILRH